MTNKPPYLKTEETQLLLSVFKTYKKLERVVLFGSRAKSCASPSSDIDLAVVGFVDDLEVEKLAMDLELLPLPYKFDVILLPAINNPELLAHISRVGIVLYEQDAADDR